MLEIVAWTGFSQGLFAAILLHTKKQMGSSDRILVGWLSLLAIEFLTCGIDLAVFGKPLLSSSFLLINPAFLLYIRSLTIECFRLRWLQLLHLLPFIFFELTTYIIREPYELVNYFNPNASFWFRVVFSLASVFSWLIYNTISCILVYRHQKKIENEFSTIGSDKKVGWLIFVVVFYNLYCGLEIVLAIIGVVVKWQVEFLPVYNYLVLLFLIYVLGFYGLKQTMIYHQPESGRELTGSNNKPLLLPEKAEELKNALLVYFEKEKPHLNPDLNMSVLAQKLLVPKHQLTEVLNAGLGKNFFLFVNEYRVEAVKKMLEDKNNPFSIEAIGYEAGFNSKSSFFTVFKKFTGYTPLQYRQLH
jgi:AraC-like DNA-binding protein